MKRKVIQALSVMLAVVLTLTAAPLSGFIGVELPEWLDASIEAEAADNRVESAISWAIAIANDDSHGYSQANRTGPDYDCSSFVSTAFKKAGFSVSGTLHTGNMLNSFVSAGFTKYNKGSVTLQRGDILLRPKTSSRGGHVELYIGNNQCVAAHSNYDGKTGDGNGKEIQVRSKNYCSFCKNSDYTYILRYEGTNNYDNYIYSFSFNANGGTLGSTGAFTTTYGKDFQILNTTCTRSGYTWAGWNVKRNNDNKWYVAGQGWCTESQISSNSYIKKVYSNYQTCTLDDSWTSGISGDCSYTFYAVWIQSRETQFFTFMSPYGQGYDHITALNNETDSGFTQERIYVWYVLHDKNTGTLLNNYADWDYSVTMELYDPNGNLIDDPCVYEDADANWLSFVPQMSGTYTAKSTFTRGDTVSTVYAKYVVEYDAELILSSNSLSLNLNGTNSKTININVGGSYPGQYNVRRKLSNSNVSTSWGSWDGNSVPLTITGNKVGTTEITIELFERYTGNETTVTEITIPVTVTANTYTINYNANGGTGLPSSQTKYYGTDITLSTTKPTRTGYTFLGWSTSSTATSATYQPGATFTSNANTTLYAVWKANTYTIKYNANGGAGTMSNSSHTYDASKALTSNAFTRSGYTFLGWSTSSTATSATYTNGQSVKNLTSTNGATVNLYAVWQSNPTYTLSYNANGGSGAPTSQTGSSNYIVSSTVPIRFGYTFLGWSTVSVATNATYEAGDSITINANTTLYAVWKAATALSINTQYSANINFSNQEVYYTFTPSSNGEYTFESTGSVDSRVYVYNTSGTEIGYDDDSSAEGTNFKLSLNLTAGTKYYVKVRAYSSYIGTISFKITGKYTISYNANGGTRAPSSQTKAYGIGLVLSTTEPTRTGYTFLGWSTSSTATSATYQPGDSFTTNADTTLYAVWKANTYTVRYNANGGTGTMSDSSHKYDVSKALTSNAFTRSGYTFLGWSTSSTATSATYTDGQSVKNLSSTNGGTVTLYAVWSELPTYTISYNANGGGPLIPANQTKIHGEALTLSTTGMGRTGYEFLGWSTSSTATSATYQPGDSFTTNADTTLYAVWKANTYTVKYNANGGSGTMSDSSHTYDVSKALTSNAFTRSGYTFLGWSTSSTATSATYTDGQSVKNLTSTNDDTVTLYAVWHGHSYTSKVTKAATCTETGIRTYTCSGCSHSYTEAIAATGHTWTAATCTSAKTCSVCKATSGEALGHSYTSTVTKAATCTTSGTRKYTCSRCSNSYTETIAATGHTWTAATCISAKTCSVCKTTSGEPLGHSYTSKVTKAATCTTSGTETFTCSKCSDSYTETIPATGHNWKDATSTEPKTCQSCGATERTLIGIDIHKLPQKTVFYIGDAFSCNGIELKLLYDDGSYSIQTTFNYTSLDMIATFTTAGPYKVTVYSNGFSTTYDIEVKPITSKLLDENITLKVNDTAFINYETSPSDINEFSQVIWESSDSSVVSINSDGKITARKPGVAEITLTVVNNGCGATSNTCTVTVVCDHNYTSKVTKAATCTTSGTKTFTCSKCSDSYTETIAATGHTWTAATCTAKKTCSTCGATSGSALGHNYTSTVTKAATCTTAGTETHTCSRCSHSYTVTIPAAGHTSGNIVVENSTAATCGQAGSYDEVIYCVLCSEELSRERKTVNALPHSYNNRVVTKEASCTESGTIVYTCTLCNDSYTEEIEALGHNYSSAYTIDVEAGCTTSGSKSQHCSRCNSKTNVTTIPALGHDYGAWIIIIEPGCTSNGAQKHTCETCGNEQVEVVSATGHKYFTVVTAPTCTTQGYSTHTCECGDSYVNNYVSATGHDYKDGSCVDCGEIDPDYNQDEPVISGTCGENVTWTYDETTGTLTISGTGPMDNYYDESNDALMERPWEEYCDGIKNVIIEDGVTSVGDCSFYEFGKIENVAIADSVNQIGKGAFAYCSNIEEIHIPNNVKSIGISAFIGCSKLTSVTIPEGVTVIGDSTFKECTSLASVTIPNSVTVIDDYAFSGCTGLKDVTIGNNVTTIGSNSFRDCTALTTISIPNTVTSIEVCAFYNCNNLSDVYYTGTQGEWDNVSIAGYNTPLLNATIHCEDDSEEPEYNYAFSIQTPSTTTIRHKDGIILHANVEGTAPDGCYVEWTSSNNNFKETVQDDGNELKIISDKNGYTTFTATLYDADGNILATDTVEMRSKAGFFDKIGSFFRGLFGGTKVHEY